MTANEKRGLVGLAGILIASIAAELNDQVLGAATADVAGGLGLARDAQAWLRMAYTTGQIVGAAVAPSLGLAFSFRRFGLFAVALSCATTLLLAATSDFIPLLVLRVTQGLAAGFTLPLLLTVALRVLKPEHRLYGLACYALTATVVPYLAPSLAALWTDGVGDYRFVFFAALPLSAAAAVLIWWGVKQEPPDKARRQDFDWLGALMVALGFGTLSIVLEQGDRYDWFNSPLIATLSLVAVVIIPLFVMHERRARVPLFRFDLFARRNFSYGAVTLVMLILVLQAAFTVPVTYLAQVHGYRPLQAQGVPLTLALSQLVLLPMVAWLLDKPRIDARWVIGVGLLCIITACGLGLGMDSSWTRGQFLPLQLLQSVGSACVVMPLLMIATNALAPPDGPFASATINTARAVAAAAGVWLLQLITRWRGALHRDRILDSVGLNSVSLDLPRAGAPLRSFDGLVQDQVATLVTIDSYLVLGSLAVVMLIIVATLPERTHPPRIAAARK